MKVLAFDIETVPDLNGLNYRDYRYLRSRGRRERTDEEFEREIAFNPFTLFVVSFSGVVLEDDTISEGIVLYLSDLNEGPFEEEVIYGEGRRLKISYLPLRADFVEGKLHALERELLKTAWERVEEADRVVSFNGYSFDGYVMKIRSMLHDIDIPQKFLTDRDFHVDLLHFLSNGEREKRYTLDFVCRKFGLSTPKGPMDGSRVAEEFYAGNYRTVALYNLRDSLAVAQLYLKVKRYLRPDLHGAEPPTENQLRYLTQLLSELTSISTEEVYEVIASFTGSEALSKRNISVFIDIVKRLK